ncbi:MAG: PHP domain-containing protein [Candidatus Hadarchaeum sp.]|nr:PHP domain-containing protein [Candidatus Hadarchaeum sp.]
MRKFNFHTHTLYSDGECLASSIVEAAEASGLAAVAITDHGPELSVGIDPAKIPLMLQDIECAREDANIPVLAGMEANVVNIDGAIDLDDEVIKKLDILVIGLHTLGTPMQEELARNYFLAIMNVMRNNRVDVIAHPFRLHNNLAPYLSPEDIGEFVKLAAEKEVAIEINSKYRVPSEEFLRTCLKEGVKLSIGTDAHTTAEVGMVDWQMAMLKRIGAKEDDLILNKFLR